MEEDKFALVEKIIKDIHNVLSKISELYAFDVVPMDVNFQNKSPVLHLENCLGLESWCVKHVYMYCYSEILDKYCFTLKRKPKKISTVNYDRLIRLMNVTLLLNPEINSLWNKRRDMVLDRVLDKDVELHFTRLVLSRKPKCNEVFAYRRWILECIFQGHCDSGIEFDRKDGGGSVPSWKNELFLHLGETKCGLRHYINSLHSSNIENLINNEYVVCDLASDKCPNNYHSWNHRIWLINTIKTSIPELDLNALYIKEYNFSEKWTTKHISDYSCFHYHQFCIKNIYNISNNSWLNLENILHINLRKIFIRVLASNLPKDMTIQASEENLISYSAENLVKFLLAYSNKICNCTVDYVQLYWKLHILFHVLVSNNELIQFYKFHETLWYHRRFVVHEIITILYDYFGLVRHNGVLIKKSCKNCNYDIRQKQAKIGRYDTSRIYSSVLFNVVMSHEKKFVEERRKDDDNYADRHEKYLKFIEGLNNVM